jgi:hypothetical protein
VNISAGEILFTADAPLPLGTPIEVSVDWPVKRDGICRLKMVVLGRIIRIGGDGAVISIELHEFRLRGR